MKGKRVIKISYPKVSFEVELERKVTILKGNSATGKTTFVDLIDSKVNNRRNASVVHLSFDAKLLVLHDGDDWKKVLSENVNCVIISDEVFEPLETREFAELVKKSDNYFLFVTRSGLIKDFDYSIIEFRSSRVDDLVVTGSYEA